MVLQGRGQVSFNFSKFEIYFSVTFIFKANVNFFLNSHLYLKVQQLQDKLKIMFIFDYL